MKSRKPALASALRGLDDSYEIVSELGRGGSSTVYHAIDRRQDRQVAIKVLRSGHLDDAEAAARLEREARILARLDHPCIVRLLDTRRLEDGRSALIMEYVRGRTLKDVIRDGGPLPIRTVESVLLDIASALEHAAGHAVVHRDIKPENIFIDEHGRARLSDFGIARIGHTSSTLTLTGSALGTPAYMSPEHIDGAHTDGRSDLYSLGLTAYEMLTGRMPWAGENLYTVLYRQKHDELPPLRDLRPDTPPHLLRSVSGLIRKHPVARWSSAAEFRIHLEDGIAAADSAAPHPVPAGRAVFPVVSEDSPTVSFVRPAHPAPVASAASGTVVQRNESETLSAQRRAAREGRLAPTPALPLAGRKRRRRALAMAALLVVIASGATVAMIVDRSDDSHDPLTAPQEPSGTANASVADDGNGTAATSDQTTTAPAAGESAAAEPSSTPARMTAVSGEDQSALAGDVLASPIAVVVEDENGEPVANAKVEFRVVEGDGNVAPAEALTDLRGRAAAAWAVGRIAGPNVLEAVVPDVPQATLRFSATGTTGPAAAIVVVDGGDGSAPSRQVSFRVEDRHANPIAGARVDIRVEAGDGRVEPASLTTPATGLARTTWVLGSVGANRIRASVAGTDIRLDYEPPPFRLARRPNVSAGGTHTCAVGSEGDARCWGGNEQGQLGTGRTSRQDGLVRVLAASPFARIHAGISHTCALDGAGAAVCWGLNDHGQLGTGDRTTQPAPAPVRTAARMFDVAAGLAHTCALADGGSALCWGSGAQGQLGHGAIADRTIPTPVVGGHTFASLTAGWRHTCALTPQGSAWCWGANADGQLGDGSTAARTAPVRVSGNHRFTGISAGAAHTCGVTTDGRVYCWGQNRNGQIGPSPNGSQEPIAVSAPVAFASVAGGAVHSCALARSGDAYCWGRNNFGQLGNESTTDSAEPVRVAVDVRFSSLSASGSHTCGRTTAGRIYCWGYNVEGQVGDATRTNRPRPVPVGPSD
jgi:serine/threonine protein kinase/alpha-tubulin suppressor-like RCC1 family protein